MEPMHKRSEADCLVEDALANSTSVESDKPDSAKAMSQASFETDWSVSEICNVMTTDKRLVSATCLASFGALMEVMLAFQAAYICMHDEHIERHLEGYGGGALRLP